MLEIRTLSENEVEFDINCLPEFLPVRGNVMATDEPDLDREAEDEILAKLERGDEWAWCCVRVTARWNGHMGMEHLGGCSYENEADFRRCEYFEDMKAQALEDLNRNLQDEANSLLPLLARGVNELCTKTSTTRSNRGRSIL